MSGCNGPKINTIGSILPCLTDALNGYAGVSVRHGIVLYRMKVG